MREIDWRLRAILDRKNLEKSFEALVHDKEMKVKSLKREKIEPVKLTEAQERAMELAIEQAKERKAKQYGSR